MSGGLRVGQVVPVASSMQNSTEAAEASMERHRRVLVATANDLHSGRVERRYAAHHHRTLHTLWTSCTKAGTWTTKSKDATDPDIQWDMAMERDTSANYVIATTSGTTSINIFEHNAAFALVSN